MGVEVFCIDSGWQASLLDDTIRSKGDWVISKSRFAPKTFEDIIESIKPYLQDMSDGFYE